MEERTQPRSGQLWHDRGRCRGEGEDREDAIRLDLRLVLLRRHIDGSLAVEVVGGRRIVVVKVK